MQHLQGWPGRLPPGSGIDHQQSSTHHMPSTEQSHPLSSHQPWNPGDVRQSIPSYPGQQQGYGGDGARCQNASWRLSPQRRARSRSQPEQRCVCSWAGRFQEQRSERSSSRQVRAALTNPKP